MSGSTCPVCEAARVAGELHCPDCGVEFDSLVVDLGAEPAGEEPVEPVERSSAVRNILSVVGLAVLLAVGIGLLVSLGDDADENAADDAPASAFDDQPVDRRAITPGPTPVPAPTLPEFPENAQGFPGIGTITPQPLVSAEPVAFGPLMLGETTGLSLAWLDGDGLHAVDLDTGERRELMDGTAFTSGGRLAEVAGRLVTASSVVRILEADGSGYELGTPKMPDRIWATPGSSRFWLGRYPRSNTDRAEISLIDIAQAPDLSAEWRELPIVATPWTATSEGLIVSLWQGAAFLYRFDGSVEELPYDAVLTASGPRAVVLECSGGADIDCGFELVDLVSGESRPLEIAALDPYSIRLGPTGRWLYRVDWNRATPLTYVIDTESGAEVELIGEPWQFGGEMAFSPDGRWLAGPTGDEVLIWRLPDPDPIRLPIDIVGGDPSFVLYATPGS